MVYLSICLCHCWFLSSIPYSFLSRALLPPYMVLFLEHIFVLFNVMVNWMVVIFHHKRFLWLILYPTTLPNSLMNSDSFLIASLGFSMYKSIMLSANSDSFTSFPIWIPFISFSSLITMAETSKIIYSIKVESGHPCCLPNLRRSTFSFSTLKIMLTVGFLWMAFIILRYVPSMSTFWRVFVISGCWILSKTFSISFEMIVQFLFFQSTQQWTGKGQFSFQSQRRVISKNVQTTAQLCSFHLLVR